MRLEKMEPQISQILTDIWTLFWGGEERGLGGR